MKRSLMLTLLMAAAATLLPTANLRAEPNEKRIFIEFEIYLTNAGNAQDPGNTKKVVVIGCFESCLRKPLVFGDSQFIITARRIGPSKDGWLYIQPSVEFTLLEIANGSVSLELTLDIASHIKNGRVRTHEYSNAIKLIANPAIGIGKSEKYRGPTMADGNQIWINLSVIRVL